MSQVIPTINQKLSKIAKDSKKIKIDPIIVDVYNVVIYDILIINLTSITSNKIASVIRKWDVSNSHIITKTIKKLALLLTYVFYYSVNIIAGNYEILILDILKYVWNLGVKAIESYGIEIKYKPKGIIMFLLNCVSYIYKFGGGNVLISFLIKQINKNEMSILREFFDYIDSKIYTAELNQYKYKPDLFLTYLRGRMELGFLPMLVNTTQWFKYMGILSDEKIVISKIYGISNFLKKMIPLSTIKSAIEPKIILKP